MFLIDYSNESSQSEASQHKKVCLKDKYNLSYLFHKFFENTSSPLEKLQDTQQFIHQLMRRYLQTSIGDYNAAREMMNTFMKSVQNLREMADILDFQRLRFI